MLRIHWITDVIIYILGAWSNQYRCRLSLISLHWFTNMPHLHSVLIRLFLKKKKKSTNSEIYTKKNICINLFLLAATTTFLSLVNEAQYLMINRASVRLIQELMSSRFEHPESLLKAWHKDACIFTLYFVICGKVVISTSPFSGRKILRVISTSTQRISPAASVPI